MPALLQQNGLNVLPSGDPNYVDLVLGGSPSPENQLLDQNPTDPLTQIILQTFGIPFSLPIFGSPLPGYDIRNQDPVTMLKLSLVTELLNNNFVEVELDEFGIARFYIVGDTPANNLDIRYCVPTSQFKSPADLVIIRGYDPPPRRELRASFDGLKNKNIFNYVDCAADSCEEEYTSRHATVSYDDPILDQVYLDDMVNAYELKAFESLVGYLIDLDLPDGIDAVPGLQITFGDTTKEFIQVGSGALVGSIESSNTVYKVYTTALASLVCNYPEEQLKGSTVNLPRSRFLRLNKYGKMESDFAGIVDVVFSGHKVVQFTSSPGAFATASSSGFWTVERRRDLISLQHGKNWVWKVDGNDNILLYLYIQLPDVMSDTIWALYNTPWGFMGLNYSDGSSTGSVPSGADFVMGLGDVLGYYLPGGSLCVLVERRRPSINIFDPRGNAVAIAEQIRITYTPIVVIDEPAPIAYASTKTALYSISGARSLPSTGIINQVDGIVDADPTTTQALSDSELSILQDNTNGATIDLSLPFANGSQCQTIAQNLLALQSAIVDTKSIILGPDSEPRLGDVLPDGSIINEIQYSYSDAGQYLITITAGPKYLTVGSFNNSSYQLQYEEVSREGIVVQDKGNGVEYVVRLPQFGEITALSMILDNIYVGDKVSVKIYNNPVERI